MFDHNKELEFNALAENRQHGRFPRTWGQRAKAVEFLAHSLRLEWTAGAAWALSAGNLWPDPLFQSGRSRARGNNQHSRWDIFWLVIKSFVEEGFLRADPQYTAYLQRVRWRWVPGIVW